MARKKALPRPYGGTRGGNQGQYHRCSWNRIALDPPDPGQPAPPEYVPDFFPLAEVLPVLVGACRWWKHALEFARTNNLIKFARVKSPGRNYFRRPIRYVDDVGLRLIIEFVRARKGKREIAFAQGLFNGLSRWTMKCKLKELGDGSWEVSENSE